MARIVQLHRMSSGAAGLYTGPQGEVIVETGAYRMRVQDGATPGGYATMIANLNLADVADPIVARANLGAAPITSPNFLVSASIAGDTIATLNAVQNITNKNLLGSTDFSVVRNSNIQIAATNQNMSNGNAAVAAWRCINDTGHYAAVQLFSTAFTPAGSVLPDSMRISTDGGGGLLFETLNPATSQRWWTNGAQRMVLDANGAVGIGINPFAGNQLSVAGNIGCNSTITAGFLVSAPAGSGYLEARSFGISYFYGNTIASTAVIQAQSNGSGGVQLLNGATSWTAISSRAYKRDIEPITNGAVERIGKMSKVLFRYNSDPDTQALRPGTFYEDALASGLSYITAYAPAEKRQCPKSKEIQDIPEMKVLSLELLVPDLMKAIDELAAEIAALKAAK